MLSGLVKPANEWERVLRESGVLQSTLDRFKWGATFAAVIGANSFSKGETELPDFLSTILHESAMLTRLKEDGSYSAARIEQLAKASAPGTRWRSLLGRADELSHNPAKFFEACYGGRMGNRPEGSGDGAKYPGRALIGVTGAANYAALGAIVKQPLLQEPERLEDPAFALKVTIDWWEDRIEDRLLGDHREIRIVVNGACIGLPDVEMLCKRVTKAL